MISPATTWVDKSRVVYELPINKLVGAKSPYANLQLEKKLSSLEIDRLFP